MATSMASFTAKPAPTLPCGNSFTHSGPLSSSLSYSRSYEFNHRLSNTLRISVEKRVVSANAKLKGNFRPRPGKGDKDLDEEAKKLPFTPKFKVTLPDFKSFAPIKISEPSSPKSTRKEKIRKGKKETEKIEKKPAGTVKLTEAATGTLKLIFGGARKPAKSLPRDDNVVFVAGASGRVGSRVVKELVKLGFKVRAASRNAEDCQVTLADLPAPPKSDGFLENLFGAKKKVVEFVEVDLENPDEIESAIGIAGKVICAIGAAEDEALNWSAPFRIDGQATKNLIAAAKDANVNQFVLVSSLGTTKIGFPASILNLFWGVLVWKAQAEKALQESGIAFTIVRPGGMERPTDDYKLTHNLVLAPKDTYVGGQVSNLQVAELIATVVSNPELSENKIVEAIAETTAPLRAIEELLADIPVTGQTQAEREEQARLAAEKEEELEQERLAKEEEEEQKRITAEQKKIEREEAARRLKEQKEQEAIERQIAEEKAIKLRSKLSAQLLEAKEKQSELEAAARERADQKAELERKRAEIRARAEAAAIAAKEARALQLAVQKAAKEGRILSTFEKEDVVRKVRAELKAEVAEKEVKETKKKVEAKKLSDNVRESRAKLITEQEAKRNKLQSAAISRGRLIEEEIAKKKADAAAKAKQEAEESAKAVAAEKEARLKAENEAKVKAEEESERLAEEARIKAEEEAKLAIEAKLKAEAEAEKVAEEARIKAEEEAKIKAEVEAKIRSEEEAKKAAEEARLKAEEEAKKEAEEARIKAEQEAEIKAEEEAKLRAEEVAKQAAEDARMKAEVEAKKAAQEEAKKKTEANPSSTDFPPSPTPLSPFPTYEGLKPPSSPTPTPPAPLPVPAPAETALAETAAAVTEKPKKGFKWFWQKEEPDEEVVISAVPEPLPVAAPETAPAPAPEPEKTAPAPAPVTAPAPVPAPVADSAPFKKWVAPQKAPEGPMTEEEKKPSGFRWPWQASGVEEVKEAAKSESTDLPYADRPLSPYTQYPGLRPPTSPTPYPPGFDKAE